MSHVVIRTVRPYASEEEYLQAEGWTITRTGVVLLEQDEHPSGTVVRFEVKLAGGQRLLRAEGSVVAFRAASEGFPSQLELRFRRFDAATKALIESAEALAALTQDEFEEIDVEALSDIEASAPVQTDRDPVEPAADAAPDSAPGVQSELNSQAPTQTQPLQTQPLDSQPGLSDPLLTQPVGTFDDAARSDFEPVDLRPRLDPQPSVSAEPHSEPNPTLDEAVAEIAQSARRSSLPPQGSSPLASDLNDSALKLDALISQALSEPPPGGADAPLTPLPASDPLPTLRNHGEALDAAPDQNEPAERERRSSRPSAPTSAASGVHAKPNSAQLRPIATPARRNELLAKLRQRGQSRGQSGSGTSSGT